MLTNNNKSQLQDELISSDELQKLRKSTIASHIAGLLVILSVAFLLVTFAHLYFKQQTLNTLNTSAQNSIKSIDTIIHNNINFLENQVQIFANDSELYRFINTKNNISKQFILNNWQTIAERIHWFSRIEYQPYFGKNSLAINFDPMLNMAFIEDSNSENSSLYNQQKSSDHNTNILELSEIHLQTRFNEVIYPLTPVLSISTHLDFGTLSSSGMLKVDILVDRLTHPINRAREQLAGHTFLLNMQGFYINAENDKQEWGQAIKERKQFNFAQTFPQEWQQINQLEHGELVTENGSFNFKKLSFNQDNSTPYTYLLVNHISHQQVSQIMAKHNLQLAVFSLFITIFSMAALYFSYKSKLNGKIQSYSQSLINVLFDSDDALLIADKDFRITGCNQIFCTLSGYGKEELLEKTISDLFVGRNNEISIEKLKSQATFTHFTSEEIYLCNKHQQHIPCSYTMAEIDQQTSDGSRFVLHILDISKRKDIENELKIAAIALESNSGILITNESAQIVRVNSAFTRITGYEADEVIGKNPRILSSNHHNDKFYQKMWQSILSKGNWQGEIWNQHKNGDIYPQWTNINRIINSDNSQYLVATFEDITLRKELEEKLKSLASTDPLTGCINRRSFEAQATKQISIAKRHQQALSVVLFDIDHFKAVNDTFGHDRGDEILIAVANTASKTLRESDIFARWGGEEFLVLLPNSDEDSGVLTAERLRVAIENCTENPAVTCSFGVSALHGDENLNELIKQADLALYEAKEKGRNKVIAATSLLQTEC
ncbi:diguanylate cyclase [Thalassotalea aquiviva]|uniref:sensor domain-containing diguanylate cyclase n=1 Tax=Thalassotalea aquiviva TaxID=3242415 RepID=UPI00352B5E3A